MTKIEVKVPSVGESVTEVTISKILFDNGAFVEEDAIVIELESDKASVEVPAPKSGAIVFTKKVGDVVGVGTVFATIDPTVKIDPPPSIVTEKNPPSITTPPKSEQKTLRPTSGGVREGLDAHIEKTLEKKIDVQPQGQLPKEVSTRVKMPKIRTVIAKRLVGVKNETAMLTTFNEVDMSQVIHIRNREKEGFLKKHGVNLSFLPFFMKAASQALKEFPEVNAYIDGDEIVYNKNVHMSIAVSTQKGLVVPVIRNIDSMSLVEMTKKMNTLAEIAREGKLSISDMAGGTFTITNGGVFGSMLSTPILNPPQSAILGLHNIVERAVVVSGKIEIRPVMYLALSYDHRIIDGKDSVQFLVRIKHLIEDPTLYILGE